MQLVAYGAQDVYLTGNPQITFFKVVYRRHTNFACEAIEQTFNGSPSLGSRATVPITRNGDLVTKMWLKTKIATSDTLVKASKSDTEYQYIIEGTPSVNAMVHAAGSKDIKVEGTAANRITVTVANEHAAFDAGFTTAVGDIIKLEGYTNTDYNGSFAVQAVTQAWGQGATDGIYVCHAPGMATGTTAETSDAATHKIAVFDKTANDEYETFDWGTDVGYSLINSVELQIGGTKIDKHYGRWMHVWSQLTKSAEHDNSHEQMVSPVISTTNSHELYVPLQFFCCRNDGLALPLIALQYHDVRLEFEFSSGQNTVKNLEADGTVGSKGGNVSLSNTTLLVNYIYLDSEERKRFAQASHEYLIEQLQFTGVETITASAPNKVRLNFNHPVKELVWAAEKSADNVNHFDFSNGSSVNPVSKALLQLNGHDRFAEEEGKFFNYVQTHTHHSRTPSAGINVYSFALNPEEHQPSGTCNFSRIDNATLTVTTATAGTRMFVYGVNYNVLRIMSGMGGVAYSN